mgnify:CR=1 FL=1
MAFQRFLGVNLNSYIIDISCEPPEANPSRDIVKS